MKPALSTIIIVFSCVQAFGDYVNVRSKHFLGRVIYIDRQNIILQKGNKETQQFMWTDSTSIKFNDGYVAPWAVIKLDLTSLNPKFGMPKAKGKFEFILRNSTESLYANDLLYRNDSLSIVCLNKKVIKMYAPDLTKVFYWLKFSNVGSVRQVEK